ncbi:MAG: hypothetical protein ACRC2V_22935, partial [Xenococcaceae cyanobacterium]
GDSNISRGFYQQYCGNLRELGKSSYTIKTKQHSQILQDALDAKVKFVLDNSFAGSGKSHRVGDLKPTDFNLPDGDNPSRFFYITQQSRNPSTATLEDNYKQLPARNKQLYTHPDKKLPSGKELLMREYQGEGSREIPGNCLHTSEFEPYYEARASSASSIICAKCAFKDECKEEENPGFYGFKYRRGLVLEKEERIRCNINGLAESDIAGTDIAFIDEYNQSLAFTESIEVTQIDWQQSKEVMRFFLRHNRDIFEALDSIFSGQIEISKFGMESGAYFEKFGQIHRSLEIARTISYEEAQQNLKSLQQGGKPSKVWKGEIVRAFIGDESYSFLLSVNPLTKLISFTIIRRNFSLLGGFDGVRRYEGILNKFLMVVFMDATATRDLLALQLGIDPQKLLCFSTPKNKNSNVTIKQISSFGGLYKNRSGRQQQKVAQMREELRQIHGDDIGFVDWKKWGQKNDLNHFVDARGSNNFQNKKAVACFGTANTNVTLAKCQFEIAFGARSNAPSFARAFTKHYAHLQQAELEQTIGRLRAYRRSDEALI